MMMKNPNNNKERSPLGGLRSLLSKLFHTHVLARPCYFMHLG